LQTLIFVLQQEHFSVELLVASHFCLQHFPGNLCHIFHVCLHCDKPLVIFFEFLFGLPKFFDFIFVLLLYLRQILFSSLVRYVFTQQVPRCIDVVLNSFFLLLATL